MPLVPVMVKEYVPDLRLLGTFMVIVDVPLVVIEVGLKVGVVHPLGVLDESVTVPVNALFGVTVIVACPEDPLLMVCEVGEAEIAKSGFVTCTDSVVVWLFVPSVPCIVTVYVPVAVLLGTATVTVDVPEIIIDVGLKVAVNPPVAVDES